jgi:pimeloyl-ACP methyl ester carboxylesterase
VPIASSNGIELAYETHGDPDNPVLLMLQGLGMPLSAWPKPLLDALVDEGFHVITFDNRDIGKSTLMRDLPVPNMLVQTIRRMVKLKVRAPYQLTDMMRDLVGLMDALEIETAHVVGVSMGGMIAQLLAIHEPQRLDSLTLIMSTTNERRLARSVALLCAARNRRRTRIAWHFNGNSGACWAAQPTRFPTRSWRDSCRWSTPGESRPRVRRGTRWPSSPRPGVPQTYIECKYQPW